MATRKKTSKDKPCAHTRRAAAKRLPPGCWKCLDCGAVGRARTAAVGAEPDDAEIPIANEVEYQLDEDKALFLMWAGAYGDTKCFVWADSFEDAFEEFVEWLDDNAPGALTDITVDDLKRAAEDEGIAWQDEWPDDSEEFYKVVEAAEVDMTAIGHTTLRHGQYIPSWEWGGDEITDDETLELVRERSEDPEAADD